MKPWSAKFPVEPWNPKIIPDIALDTCRNYKYVPITSFRHIFATIIPILVILAPKFSESVSISSKVFMNPCLLHFID
jgi:hypothetical protein